RAPGPGRHHGCAAHGRGDARIAVIRCTTRGNVSTKDGEGRLMATPEHDASKCLVGIVVVSHSRALARAAVELPAEMLQGRPVPIAMPAGLDEVTLGTDAVRIKEAIQQVDSPAGVAVLMDLGRAVPSAERALDPTDT